MCCTSSVCTLVLPLPPLYLHNLLLSVISLGFFVLTYVCIFLSLISFFSSLPHLSYFFAVLIHSMSVFHLENFIKGERGSRGEAGEKFFLYFCWCITVVVWGGNQPSTTTANMLLRKKEFSQFRWTHNILLCSVSSAFLDFLVLLSFCCP